MERLPNPTSASCRANVVIDGKPYVLRWEWNTRGQFWTLDLLTADEQYIYKGVKIVLDYDLWGDIKDERMPKGQLFCVVPSGAINRLARDSFENGLSELVFVPRSEVA